MSNFIEDEADVSERVSTSSGRGRGGRGRGGRGNGRGRGRMSSEGVDPALVASGKHTRFRWTLFNYDDNHIRMIKAVDRYDMFHCRYMCFQHEICPTTGSPHLQGYAEFSRQVHWGTLKSMVANHISIRTCDKSGSVNRAYCMKTQEGAHDFWEHGDIVEKGQRTDLDMLCTAIEAGKTLKEVAEMDPATFIRNYRGIQFYKGLLSKPRSWKTEVYWYYGPTGTGKSHTAAEEARAAADADTQDVYYKMAGSKWWDGYDGHSYVVIDDFRADMAPFYQLLLWFDKYPTRVEIKGASTELVAKKIWITCPKTPKELYAQSEKIGDEDIQQLMRRITTVKHFAFRYLGSVSAGRVQLGTVSSVERHADVEADVTGFDDTQDGSQPIGPPAMLLSFNPRPSPRVEVQVGVPLTVPVISNVRTRTQDSDDEDVVVGRRLARRVIVDDDTPDV